MVFRLLRTVLIVGTLAGCGYRPAAGLLAPTADVESRYLPFLVRNDTADLSLANVVVTAARGELGRRNLLASSSDRADGPYYRVEMRLRSLIEVPASYSPEGDIIEYFGQLYLDYAVFQTANTEPVAAVSNSRLTYRYDFRTNPQNIRVARQAAIGEAIRDWIPVLMWQTATGDIRKGMQRQMADPVSATVMPGTVGNPAPMPDVPEATGFPDDETDDQPDEEAYDE